MRERSTKGWPSSTVSTRGPVTFFYRLLIRHEMFLSLYGLDLLLLTLCLRLPSSCGGHKTLSRQGEPAKWQVQIGCKKIALRKSFHLPTSSKFIGSLFSSKWGVQARVMEFMPAHHFTLACQQGIAQSSGLAVPDH